MTTKRFHDLTSLTKTILSWLVCWLIICPRDCAGANAIAGDESRPATLIILAAEKFQPRLDAYIKARGSSVKASLQSLESILQNSIGSDDAEKVKRWLYERWIKEPFEHLLLVGDADIFPIRYMVLDRVTAPAFDYAFYPSDLYYADLAKPDLSFESWNASCDGFHATYFGEVRGEKNKSEPINFDQIDYRPEIAVGRWPISSEAELEIVIAKSLAYEKQLLKPADKHLPQAALVYVGGWVDCRRQIRSWGDRLSVHWNSNENFQIPEHPEQSRHSAEAVLTCLNQGCDLVLHAGHGYPEGWDQSIGVDHISKIENADRLPVVLSAGCSTAYFATLPPYESYIDVNGREHTGTNAGEVFDAPPPAAANYQTGNHNRTGLGEQLLKSSPNGAVAYFGCNTGSQPCGLTLLEGFVDHLAQEKRPRLGDCWRHSINYYFEHQKLADLKPDEGWYPPSIFFQGMKFMLFGDPSLPMAGN